MTSDRIHLVFCLFQRNDQSPYPMALAATYGSIRQRTSAAITVHVIADDSVTSHTRRRLRRSMTSGDRLCFCPAEAVPEAHRLSLQLDGRFSPAIVWRAWIPEYLPKLNRCILLDCDLQILLDIRRIWELDLGGMALSAFQGGKEHPQNYYDWLQTSREFYFRMGVCVFDLGRIRKHREFMTSRCQFLVDACKAGQSMPQANLLEQSLFNRYFSKLSMPLPFPLVPADLVNSDPIKRKKIDRMLLRHEPIVLDIKGWRNFTSLSFLFWSSLLHTPWRECANQQGLKPPEPPQSPT